MTTPLFSRRSVMASVAATLARAICPGAVGKPNEAAAQDAETWRLADTFGEVSYYRYDEHGRLLSAVTHVRQGDPDGGERNKEKGERAEGDTLQPMKAVGFIPRSPSYPVSYLRKSLPRKMDK